MFLSILLTLVTQVNAGNHYKIECKLYGAESAPPYNYKTIVKARFEFDSDQIPYSARNPGNTCKPNTIKSQVFESSGGTTLQITASKCGSRLPYFHKVLHLEGMPFPILGVIDDSSGSRMSFNHDRIDTDHEGSRVVISEGTFFFLYLDCTIDSN